MYSVISVNMEKQKWTPWAYGVISTLGLLHCERKQKHLQNISYNVQTELILHPPWFGFSFVPGGAGDRRTPKDWIEEGTVPFKKVLNPKKWYCGFRTPKNMVWGGRTIPFLPKKGVQGVP